ncbi:uncharacterized protein CPUR_08733 [Claviceps purpurea 20.1]|uniref:Uncharacterized protein n=1 Tax=Claviceps purpurea (strain 20.1) TaxID=1111077 RepID=M1VZB6_CLAP2|nr:uncharacterized protein CPUR_08733 [Claviceps purpurea 20.1]
MVGRPGASLALLTTHFGFGALGRRGQYRATR